MDSEASKAPRFFVLTEGALGSRYNTEVDTVEPVNLSEDPHWSRAAGNVLEEYMKVMVIGVHRVDEAPEPCHLIELLVEGEGEFAVGSITQPNPTTPEVNWQVPYDEYRLAPDGRSGEPLGFAPVDVHRHIRLALFFHYLSPTEPLRTPAGPVALPPVTPMPRRLRFMKYEPPS